MTTLSGHHPLITIGITSYCSESTISRAIASAITQDWPNIELLIVDDCSPDDSARVIEQVIVGIPHARLIRHTVNGGPAAARNSILNVAQGEFIAFFDDDDESLPQRLQIQHERLCEYEASSGASLIACYASGARRYPNAYELQISAIGAYPTIPDGEAVADYLLFNGRRDGVFYGAGTPTCALMARRSTFEAVNGFDPNLRRVEDVDFAIRLALKGGHFIGCTEKLYLQHATFGSDKTPLMNLKAELQLVEKFADYLKRKKRFDYAHNWFKIRYYHFSHKKLHFFSALTVFLLRHPFSGLRHLVRSAPGRWRHERSIQTNKGVVT